MTTEMVTYRGAVLAEQDRGRISGLLPVFLPEVSETPTIRWKATKISARLWGRIKSFMLWSQQQFNSEAQLRLYFNDRSMRWRAVVWPQYIGTGLYSEEINEDKHGTDPGIREKAVKQKELLLKLVNPDKGWYEYGTVHHHCTASAFQSGTDHNDEIDRPGIHITVGNLLSDRYSLHARFVINKTLYKVVLEDWIDCEDLHKPTYNSFPFLWTQQCFEKPKPVIPEWKPGRAWSSQDNKWIDGPKETYATFDDWDDLERDLPPKFGSLVKPSDNDLPEGVQKTLQYYLDSIEDYLNVAFVIDDAVAEVTEIILSEAKDDRVELNLNEQIDVQDEVIKRVAQYLRDYADELEASL